MTQGLRPENEPDKNRRNGLPMLSAKITIKFIIIIIIID